MKFKIGAMETKKILHSIFIVGLIIFIISIPNSLKVLLLATENPGDFWYMKYYYIIYRINLLVKPILGLIIFKLSCEILYKVVKACEIIIENHNKKDY